jgi:prepilin-type N-terminal cleavage/methylation domain-containing protein
MKYNGKKANKGFTLIELLVVIAIIALLLSILMPALGKVKEQAKQIVCASNLKQSGQACYVYATEYDGFIPPIMGWTNTAPSVLAPGTSLGNYVYKQSFGLIVAEPFGWSSTGYLPDAESLICPGDRTDGLPNYPLYSWKTREKGYWFKNYHMSYTYFFLLPQAMENHYTTTDHGGDFDNVSRYHIEKTPGAAVILMDRGYWGDDPVWSTSMPPEQNFHKTGKNLLHLDTRVSFVKGSLIEDLFLIEEATSGESNGWVNRLNVLDKL